MKWRIYKKKFKRDVLPKMRNVIIGVDAMYGIPMRVIDVKFRRAGRHLVSQQWIVEPVYKNPWPQAQEVIDRIEEHITANGFDISYDIPRQDFKNIKALFGE